MRVKALHNVFAVLWVPTAISFPAMPAFPLSLRLAVWPLWGVARLRGEGGREQDPIDAHAR